MFRKIHAGIKKALIQMIQFYRITISPFWGQHCRFYPSCSEYAQEAIDQKGILKGIFFSLKRLIKCQPFHPGGIDVLTKR